MKLGNIKIGPKFVLLSALGVIQLAFVAGLSLWTLRTTNAVAVTARLYAQEMTLAVQVSDNLSQVELIVTNLEKSRQVGQDLDRLLVFRKRYREALGFLKNAATASEEQQLLARMDQLLADWRQVNDPVIAAARAGKHLDSKQVQQDSIARFATFQTAHAEYLQYRQRRMDELDQAREASSALMNRIVIGFGLFSLCTAVGFGTLLGRSVATPLAAAVTHLNQIASGDISHDLPSVHLARGDEIGTLGKAMQAMCVSLRSMIEDVSNGVGTLATSSAHLSSSSTKMTAGSRNASERAHSVAAAAEQMSSNTTSVATGMELATNNLVHIAEATEEMTATIGEIAGNSEKARRITSQATTQAARITEQIQELSRAAREIGKVTETITEISSQTNLLALNATIEAARAGSAGKRFAVVANEIKALAQQTAEATEHIKTRIGGVQSATANGITEIEKIAGVIHDVSDIVASIATAIEEQSVTTKDIAQNVSATSQGVSDANVRVAETSHVSGEIAKDIQVVDRAAGDMAGGSEQVQTSAKDLARVAEQLQTAISRFHVAMKVNPDTLQKAIDAHKSWNDRLHALIDGAQLDIPITTIAADHLCVFGKWLYGAQLSTAEKECKHCQSVKQLHAKFHKEAARIAQMAVSGEQAAAVKAMVGDSEYGRVSQDLTAALSAWIASC